MNRLCSAIVSALIGPPPKMNRLDVEIANLKSSMQRTQARMDELWQSVDCPGMDEHEAALGGCHGEYFKLSQKQDRRREWLILLLKKRGQPADISLASALKCYAWP